MKYIDPEAAGSERQNKRVPARREKVDNCLCPRDGHYCEQPNCENCQFERDLS